MSGISKTWRPILKKILSPFKPPAELPLGLSREQVDSLAQLVALPSWRAYSKLLESVGEQLLTEIVRGLPHEQYIAKCGELKMLERSEEHTSELQSRGL